MSDWKPSPWPGEQEEVLADSPPTPWSEPYGGSAHRRPPSLPSGLKLLAVLLSLAKAVPVVFYLFLAGALASLSDDLDTTSSVLSGAVAVVVGIMVIGVVFLIGQVVAAVKSNKLWLAIFAGILAAIDGLFLVSAILNYVEQSGQTASGGTNGWAIGVGVLGVVAACQFATFVWALVAGTEH